MSISSCNYKLYQFINNKCNLLMLDNSNISFTRNTFVTVLDLNILVLSIWLIVLFVQCFFTVAFLYIFLFKLINFNYMLFVILYDVMIHNCFRLWLLLLFTSAAFGRRFLSQEPIVRWLRLFVLIKSGFCLCFIYIQFRPLVFLLESFYTSLV